MKVQVKDNTQARNIIDGQNTPLMSNSDYVWKSINADMLLSGTSNPTVAAHIGTILGYVMSGTVMNQVMCNIEIPHDYAVGTKVYPYIRWQPVNTSTGVVRFGIQYTIAKGYGQSKFSTTTTTVYMTATLLATDQYKHFITEVPDISAILSTELEPMSVIRARVFRDAANAIDTHTGTIGLIGVGLHYQSARIGTVNKTPPYFT